MSCHLGDFPEYARLREDLSRLERSLGRQANAERRHEAETFLAALRTGDVFRIPKGKWAGSAVVVGAAERPDDPRPRVVTGAGHLRRLSIVDVPEASQVLGRIRVPKGFSGKDVGMRRDLGQRATTLLAEAGSDLTQSRHPKSDDEVARLRNEIRAHACHGCQDREYHARWAERANRTRMKVASLQERVASRTNSIARHFDKVCSALIDLGYLQEEIGRAHV